MSKEPKEPRFCSWCGLTASQLRMAGAPSKDGKFLVRSQRGDYCHCLWPGCLEEENGSNEQPPSPIPVEGLPS